MSADKLNNSLSGRVSIVTGGSSGIGRAASLALAGEGASVVVVGRNKERVFETIDEMSKNFSDAASKEKFLGLVLDVSKGSDMDQMRDRVMDQFGRIDILVASAGIGKSTLSKSVFPVEAAKLPLEEWEEVLDINLTGVFLSNRAVLPVMTDLKGGIIINISSFPAGRKGQPYACAYSASKFAVAGFSESLAEEVQSFGIKVHVIFPGLTETPMTSGTALESRFGKSLKAGRIADLILYLVNLPSDTIIQHPVILPFMSRKRKRA